MRMLSIFLTSKPTTCFLMLLIPAAVVLILVSNRYPELAGLARNAGFLILISSILLLVISAKLEAGGTQVKKDYLAFPCPCVSPTNLYVMSWMSRLDINDCLIFEGVFVGKNAELHLTVMDSYLHEKIQRREIRQIKFPECRVTKRWYEKNEINDSGLSACLVIFSDLRIGEIVSLLKNIKFKQSNLSLGFRTIDDSTYAMLIDFEQIPFSVNEAEHETKIEFS